MVGALCLSFSAAVAQSDKGKPTGRACLAIMNTANGDEEAFRPTSAAGRNQKLVVHLDATQKAEALVAPFSKSSQLVAGWRPQFVDLTAGAEVLLPKAPVSWSWEKDIGPIEIYVLFFASGSKEGGEIRGLVAAMQNSKDDGVAKLQGNKLRQLVGRAYVDKAAAQRPPKPSSEVAGVMRMVVGFEWRDSARSVNFSPEKPGAIVFP
jgi:hypothetical protein